VNACQQRCRVVVALDSLLLINHHQSPTSITPKSRGCNHTTCVQQVYKSKVVEFGSHSSIHLSLVANRRHLENVVNLQCFLLTVGQIMLAHLPAEVYSDT